MDASPPTYALSEACEHAAALAWQAGESHTFKDYLQTMCQSNLQLCCLNSLHPGCSV